MQPFSGFWLDIASTAHQRVHAEATALSGQERGYGTSTHQSMPMLSRSQPSIGCMWPLKGRELNPDWTHCCFSCGVRSWLERVLCKKPVKSFRNSCTTFSEAEASSELNSVSGKRLQRRVHSPQLKIEGCAELKTTTSPALSSECGSVTSRTPCPYRSASTLCCV